MLFNMKKLKTEYFGLNKIHFLDGYKPRLKLCENNTSTSH